MNRNSIRRHLLILLLPAIFSIWLLAAIFSFFDTKYQVEKLFDAQLAQTGRVLLSLSEHEIYEQRLLSDQLDAANDMINSTSWQLGHPYEKKLAFQVWINKDTLALRSDNAPRTHFTNVTDGYIDLNLEGFSWRVFSIQSDGGLIQAHVAEQTNIRHQLVNAVVWRTLIPVLIALPFIGLIIWVAIGKGMLQLNRIARELGQRKPKDLTPIEQSNVPIEIEPLTQALNRIFDHLKTAFDLERRFTADAAHELRTPLAALKTHAEVALGATNENDKRQALSQIVRGVDRATRLVEQLLTLARLDPETGVANTKRFDLFIVAERVISDEALVAIEKNIDISLNGTRGKFVYSNPDAIAVLMRNIIDNAIRYTPENGEVQVHTIREDENIILRVDDSGPGIPPDMRDKIFQRFFRMLGTKSPGSGLGLSIVARIIDLYKLRIELSEADIGGLRIDVHFKAMDADPTVITNNGNGHTGSESH